MVLISWSSSLAILTKFYFILKSGEKESMFIEGGKESIQDDVYSHKDGLHILEV